MRDNIRLLRKKVSRSYAQMLDHCGYSRTVRLLDRPVKLSSYSRNALVDCERAASQLFVSWLGSGANVLDIGANYGRYTMIAAEMLQPGQKVVAVEADPLQFHVLRRNVELNPWRHTVLAVNTAAWDEDCSIAFHISEGGRSSAAAHWGNNLKRVAVQATSMDKLLAEIGFKPDVVKIDVEGAEYRCLLGMQATLRQQRPKLLLELHPAALQDIGGSVQEIAGLLRDHSYRIFDLDSRPIDDLASHAEEHKMVVALAQPS